MIHLRPLGHPDTVVNEVGNMWYCFYYNVSQVMILRYSPVLKQKLVQTSDSIQSFHTMNYVLIDEALDFVRNPSVLVYMYIFVDKISPKLCRCPPKGQPRTRTARKSQILKVARHRQNDILGNIVSFTNFKHSLLPRKVCTTMIFL